MIERVSGAARRAVVGGVLWLVCAPLLAQALPPGAERVLRGHSIPREAVGIVVEPLGEREPIVALNPDASLNPASVMKLVTTWAALEMLGPAYTWPTEVYLDGTVTDGRLDGDVIVKGFGDPNLVLEEVWKILRTLRRLGLEEIDGDLVIDDSFFVVDEPPPGAFDGQGSRTYNVVPNALLMNFKAVRFEFAVDAANNRVRVTTEPPLPNLDITNRISVGSGACAAYQAGISLDVIGSALDEVRLGGSFSRRCGTYSMTRTALDHDAYAFGLFTSLWRELGGRFEGKFRRGTAPEAQRPALVWHSMSLADIVRRINKNSNNVMTRQLVYTLGAYADGVPGTRASGEQAIERFLAEQHGLDTGALVLANGSGLSRDARLSPRLLTGLLQAAAASPYAAEFVSSLSLAGQDGTTRNRFNGQNAVMHVKSGRLDHVSALSGYVRASSGRDFVVAVIVNHEDAHRGPGQELEEAVMRWVHESL